MERLSSDFSSESKQKKSDQIFDEGDILDVNEVSANRSHNQQIQDTYGKENIDEKLIAIVTGAKQPLPKARGGDRLGGASDILEMI